MSDQDSISPTSQATPGGTTLVMKFGGTSVGTPEAMAQVVGITRRARQDWPRVVVIISALSGVTNLLLESATQAALGQGSTFYTAEARLRELHYAIAEQLVSDLARRAQVK